MQARLSAFKTGIQLLDAFGSGFGALSGRTGSNAIANPLAKAAATAHRLLVEPEDAGAAAADMRRRFKFLGDTGVWRLLTSASRDIG